MPKKPRATSARNSEPHGVEITSFGSSLRVPVDEPKDPQPEIEVKVWLELRGVLDAPVRETSDIVLSLHQDERTKVGTARPPAVGSIIGVRSAAEAVVGTTCRQSGQQQKVMRPFCRHR